jgi:hypothetical protein
MLCHDPTIARFLEIESKNERNLAPPRHPGRIANESGWDSGHHCILVENKAGSYGGEWFLGKVVSPPWHGLIAVRSIAKLYDPADLGPRSSKITACNT